MNLSDTEYLGINSPTGLSGINNFLFERQTTTWVRAALGTVHCPSIFFLLVLCGMKAYIVTGWYVFRTKAAVQLLKNAARASAVRNTQDSYVRFWISLWFLHIQNPLAAVSFLTTHTFSRGPHMGLWPSVEEVGPQIMGAFSVTCLPRSAEVTIFTIWMGL